MSQIHDNHTGTKKITCVLSKWLPSHSTDSNHNEVLWEASHAQHQNQPPQHTRSAPVCIPPKPLYGCNFLHPPPGSYPPRNKDSYVRMLFIDFSSAFNTIIPQQLINKLSLLGLNNSLCNWILDFLTGRPQFGSATTPRALPHWAQGPHRAVCSARCSSRCWPTTALPSSAPTTSSSSPMTHQW